MWRLYDQTIVYWVASSAFRSARNEGELSEAVVREARDLSIDISQACKRGLALEIVEAKTQRWLRENRAAMDAWNDYVGECGRPLAEFRQF